MISGNMLLAAILSIGVFSSKGILICNEETIVACCFIGFLIFSQRSFGNTSKAAFQERIKTIQRELQQFLDPNEVVFLESKERQQNLRISLRSITPEILESLLNEMARCAPKCERTVQAVLCRNLNVELATLLNAISSRRSRLRNDIVTGFHSSVIEKFVDAPYTHTAFPVELIRENIAEMQQLLFNWEEPFLLEHLLNEVEKKYLDVFRQLVRRREFQKAARLLEMIQEMADQKDKYEKLGVSEKWDYLCEVADELKPRVQELQPILDLLPEGPDEQLQSELEEQLENQRRARDLRYDEKNRKELRAQLDRARAKQMEDYRHAWEKEQDAHKERIWYNEWLKGLEKLHPVERALNLEIYDKMIKDKDE